MAEATERVHSFHAESTVLEGHLQLPLVQDIKPQAYVKLPEQGGYLSQRSKCYRLEAAISFHSAYTQVAGNRDVKPGHGWSTVATSVVEGLNVLDIVTADRVVGQMTIDHPLVGYVPHVTFLGTRFENLRIAGHPVKLDLDLDTLGTKPENDAPYSKSRDFIDRVAKQHASVRAHPNLLAEFIGRYTGVTAFPERPEAIECSLVNQADGSFPGQCFGHVIQVPNFGSIILAALRLEQSDYRAETGIPRCTTIQLTMIELRMGCLAAGKVTIVKSHANGVTRP